MKFVFCFILLSSSFMPAIGEVCSSTVNSLWSYSNDKIELVSVKQFNEQLCDPGKIFPGANVEFQFLDENNKIIYKKYEHLVFERLSHSEHKKNKDVVILNWKDSKIVKFPKFKNFDKVKKFRVIGVNKLKLKVEGDFKL